MRNIKNNRLFWTDTDSVPAQYPWLSADVTCEAAIIGAGISGAMCAMRFAREGVNCVLIEGETVASGQTAGSAGVLYYYPGASLHSLSQKRSMDDSVKIFEMCASAVNNTEKICEQLKGDTEFRRKDIFAFSQEENARELKKEYLMRLHNGFSLDLLEAEECEKKFAFMVESGLYSYGQGAEVNPFRLTHALVECAQADGARVFENSPIKTVVRTHEGCDLYCENGNKVRCKKVIVATGFLSDDLGISLPAVRAANYTMVTQPVKDFAGWHERCILESNEERGFVVRTTADNRILISGLNTVFIDTAARLSGLTDFQSMVEKRRYCELEEKLEELFPAIRGLKAEYFYKTDVCEARDGLPLIGVDRDNPNCYYALCGGMNGIVGAEIASRLLMGLYSKNATKELSLFCPEMKRC